MFATNPESFGSGAEASCSFMGEELMPQRHAQARESLVGSNARLMR